MKYTEIGTTCLNSTSRKSAFRYAALCNAVSDVVNSLLGSLTESPLSALFLLLQEARLPRELPALDNTAHYTEWGGE